jgi:glycosyltransferase involved in cell wall biosynthesis
MKIAQIAPLFESVPPRGYGGTERIVSYLTEELVRRGHDVTLFASGDSSTTGKLVPCCDEALRLNNRVRDALPHQIIQLEKVRQRIDHFDVLHFHTDLIHMPLIRSLSDRTVTTLHGRLDLPDLAPFYDEFRDIPLVSISKAQRWPLPDVTWAGNVPHGLPRHSLPFKPFADGDYLAFLGRISPEKRPDRAIEIARRAGMKLKIAKIDCADRAYWEQTIYPLIDGNPNVEFVGEINERQKASFLGNARALLFPIDWPEPFGLVMIEAIACGTPVVAFRCGSVTEVIEDGISGLIVSSVDEAVEAVRHIDQLNRLLVRRAFERRFTAEAMARAYLEIYRSLPGAKTGALAIGSTNRLPSEVESKIVFLEQKGPEHRSVRFEQRFAGVPIQNPLDGLSSKTTSMALGHREWCWRSGCAAG